MKDLNNWNVEKVIHKDKILEFKFLSDKYLIEELIEGHFYLKRTFYDVELMYYSEMNKKLMQELNLKDPTKEVKQFVNSLKIYNKAKDIAESLIGKIAEFKGLPIKEIHKEMSVDFDVDAK